MNKKVLRYLVSIFIAALSVCVSSCGDDEPEVPGQIDNSGDSNCENSGGNTDVASIVKSCSSCSSSYVDYHVNIAIDHTILQDLPGARLAYVVGHAESGNSTCQVISGSQYAISPTVITSGIWTSAKMQFPFYYYFMAKRAEAVNYTDREYYANAVSECEMYLSSYLALKGKSNMSASERTLYNEVKGNLDKYQNEVRGSYTIWVYISVNGKNYLVKSINI